MMSSKTPQFVYVISLVAIVSLLLTTLVAWRVDLLGQDEENRDCARAIAAREDNRTMWLYLLDTADAKPAEVEAFRVELNKRLPALECHGGNPIPIE